jgi:hypothetical protein
MIHSSSFLVLESNGHVRRQISSESTLVELTASLHRQRRCQTQVGSKGEVAVIITAGIGVTT